MTPEEELALRNRIDAERPQLAAAAQQLAAYVQTVCSRMQRGSGLRERFIEGGVDGVKPDASIIRKVSELGAAPADVFNVVGDLIRTRVVVYNTSDVDAFTAAVRDDGACPLIDPEVELIDDREIGYRATHINGRLGDYGAEIQVRTAIADVWAASARLDSYRSPEPDQRIDRLLSAVADVLRGVDDMLEIVRDIRYERFDIPPSTEPPPEEPPEEPPPEEPPPEEPQPPTPDPVKIDEAIRALTPEQRYVIDSPLSIAKIGEFREGIESTLRTYPMQRLFRAADSHDRVHEYRPDVRFGYAINLFKGPFVEGSNWVSHRPSAFAASIETFLQDRFSHRLVSRMATPANADALTTADQVEEFIERSAERMRNRGGHPDIVVLLGDPLESLRFELWRQYDVTSRPMLVRGVNIDSTAWVTGQLTFPVFEIGGTDRPASIHLVDLADYRYVQSNPTEESDDDFLLDVKLINDVEAAKLIAQRPELLTELPTAQGETARTLTLEEAIAEFRQRVRLELQTAGDIVEVDQPRTASAGLAPASTP